jgi:uncharacterized protein
MKANSYVIDACALIALVNREPGHEVVIDLLRKAEEGTVTACMHAVNLCEVFYDCLRTSGARTADTLLKTIDGMPLIIVDRIDNRLLREAGKIKVAERLSLADAFAAGLANMLNALLVTADHHEFETIAEKGMVKVHWIR